MSEFQMARPRNGTLWLYDRGAPENAKPLDQIVIGNDWPRVHLLDLGLLLEREGGTWHFYPWTSVESAVFEPAASPAAAAPAARTEPSE